MNAPKKQLASEVLIDLHRRLSVVPSRSHERRMIMQETAHLYGIFEQTLYRALAQRARPKALRPPVRRSLYPDSINHCASQRVKILLENSLYRRSGSGIGLLSIAARPDQMLR